jgi:Capsule polysaccharide biosynthesis protein
MQNQTGRAGIILTDLLSLPSKLYHRARRGRLRVRENRAIAQTAARITAGIPRPAETAPVIFFRASAGPNDFSLNSGFHVLASWALRLQRVPVIHFACQSGMSHCVLGSARLKPTTPPPCKTCIAHSRALHTNADVHWFHYQRDPELADKLNRSSISELLSYRHSHNAPNIPSPVPLGELVTPGLRWILRRHNLLDDDGTRYLCREFMLSAWSIALEFSRLLDQTHPRAVVVFNGQFFPEATARWLAQSRGIPSFAHEVGLQPFSAFFTAGEPTAYPIDIPENFELSDGQNARLDAYLEKRFQGNFTMAGIKFWPEMKGLDEPLIKRIAQYKQVVPVFTNVVFDTSQPHANTLFSDMFAWLDEVLELIRRHPETFFVIRAHPDESRPGKESAETVAGWVTARSADSLPNVVFIPPHERLSSYELIQRSKFVMIYNSTIGLEAAIMGAPVISGGRARFTRFPIVFLPSSIEGFIAQAEEFLAVDKVATPPAFQKNARKFLYYQLFRTSLPFEHFLGPGYHPSFTHFKDFILSDLLPENSPALQAILGGILEDGDFLLEE